MSSTSRPTSHWSSSRLPTSSNNYGAPLLISRKKITRPSKTNQPVFAEHMAKTQHDVEELFKLCCSNDTKLSTFQQVVTGKHISGPQTSLVTQSHDLQNSTDVFKSKHCVSREDFTPSDIHYDEYLSAINELQKLPTKRSIPGRNDQNSMFFQSINPLSSLTVESIPSNSSFTIPKKTLSSIRQDELPPLSKSTSVPRKGSSNSIDRQQTKKSKLSNNQRPISSKSSLTTLSSIPTTTTLSSITNRKDPINLSFSSLSTTNSIQEQNPPNILTGTAIIAQPRSRRHIQRPKSNRPIPANLHSQQSNIRTSSFFNASDVSEYPVNIVTQPVASIPSKCSRYVLITVPQASIRYKTPTYVERLLLPERFPILFQNILHNSERHLDHK